MDSILLDIKSKLTDLIANSSRKGVFDRYEWNSCLLQQKFQFYQITFSFSQQAFNDLSFVFKY